MISAGFRFSETLIFESRLLARQSIRTKVELQKVLLTSYLAVPSVGIKIGKGCRSGPREMRVKF
jgi:hypothetical protein